MKKFFTFIAVLITSLALSAQVQAANSTFDFRNIFNDFQKGVEEQSGELEDGAEEIIFPSFQDQQSGTNDGLSGIVGTIMNFLDLFKLIVTPVVVIFVVIQGVKMISSRESEDAITKAKNYVTYAVMGLVVIFVADSIVQVMFGAEGEVFREGEAGAAEFGRRSSQLFEGIYSLVETIIGAVAVFMLITAGMRYVAGSYNDDQIAAAKRQIIWSLVGLFVIGVSEFVVKEILFQDQGQGIGIDKAKELLSSITNFIAGAMSTLSLVFMLYAGYLYVVARDNEDMVAKAKKILMGALIGLVLAAGAFAIVSTIVTLDTGR